jgi:hypothetical protein
MAVGERSTPFTLAELAPFLAVPSTVMRGWAWTGTNPGELKLLYDGDRATRWSTGKPQEPGQFVQFDAGKPFRLTRLVLDTQASRNDFPRQFEVRTSSDGAKWSNPIIKGVGKPLLELDLPAGTVARYVRIVQTGPVKGGNFWSVHELSVFGAEESAAK